jgi:hypothetical protein
MRKLFVVGDSFGFPYKKSDANTVLWPEQCAQKLAKETGEPIELENACLIGCSQDYMWTKIDEILEKITPNDYLLIVLTSLDRFWFFEDRPEYSNIRSVENANHIAGNNSKIRDILLGFITNIWRNNLAIQLQKHRMGYLSYEIVKRKLRKPIILKGFSTQLDTTQWPDLIFSHGILLRTQLAEFEKNINDRYDFLLDNEYWHHIDCRYNHLCLSNHKVLSDEVTNGFLHSVAPDLTSDKFHKNLITAENCKNQDFANKELNPDYFKDMMNNRVRQGLGAKTLKLLF